MYGFERLLWFGGRESQEGHLRRAICNQCSGLRAKRASEWALPSSPAQRIVLALGQETEHVIGDKCNDGAVSQLEIIQSTQKAANLRVQVRNGGKVALADFPLKIHRNWAIGHTEVQGLDVLPLPNVHPGVVGHGREASRDLGVRSQGDVLQGIQLLKLLGVSEGDVRLMIPNSQEERVGRCFRLFQQVDGLLSALFVRQGALWHIRHIHRAKQVGMEFSVRPPTCLGVFILGSHELFPGSFAGLCYTLYIV